MERTYINNLVSHINKVVKKELEKDSPSSFLSKNLAPYITYMILLYIVLQLVPAAITSFLGSWTAMVGTYIMTKMGTDTAGVPTNLNQLKDKIYSFIPDSLKVGISEKIESIVDTILGQFGTDQFIREFFESKEDEIHSYSWYIEKIKLLASMINKKVIEQMEERVEGFMLMDEKRLLIINEYLRNTIDDDIRKKIAKQLNVECPEPLHFENGKLITIKDTLDITFPQKLINECGFTYEEIYNSLFKNPILIRLHLLLWFINLPNHLKIRFYFKYDYTKELGHYFENPKMFKSKQRVMQFFFPNNLSELVNMNQNTWDKDFAEGYYKRKAEKRCEEFLANK